MKTLIISYGFTDYDRVDGELMARRTRSASPSTAATSPSASRCPTPPPRPSSPDAVDRRASPRRHAPACRDPSTPDGHRRRAGGPGERPAAHRPERPPDHRRRRRRQPRRHRDDHGVAGAAPARSTSPAGRSSPTTSTEQDDGSLTGAVIDESEQLIIGASNPIFMTPAPVDPAPRPRQQPDHPDPRRGRLGLRPPAGRARRPVPADARGHLVNRPVRPAARRRSPAPWRSWRRRAVTTTPPTTGATATTEPAPTRAGASALPAAVQHLELVGTEYAFAFDRGLGRELEAGWTSLTLPQRGRRGPPGDVRPPARTASTSPSWPRPPPATPRAARRSSTSTCSAG